MEENFAEDFSGCTWGNGSPDINFPHWLSSFKETIDYDIDAVNSNLPLDYHSCVPKTPEVLVLTSILLSNEAEGDKSPTNYEYCTCIICNEPTFLYYLIPLMYVAWNL